MKKDKYDYIIIGAGTAGLASAQYGARAGLSTLIIENVNPGGQALLIDNVENYPGVYPSVHGYELIDNMRKQTIAFGAEIISDTVISIDKVNKKFIIHTQNNGAVTCATVLIATGAEHRHLNVPGEETFCCKGVSYCATCDGPFFRNKKIFVIGGGDSACTESLFLSTISEDITLVHRRSTLRAQKSVIDSVLQDKNIVIRFNSIVKEIKGTTKVESIVLTDTMTKTDTELPCDAVFVFAGMIPRTDLVEILPKDTAGYVKTDENMSTVIPGMFCAGDVRSKPFRQLITAASDGAIAAAAAEKYIRLLKQNSYNSSLDGE